MGVIISVRGKEEPLQKLGAAAQVQQLRGGHVPIGGIQDEDATNLKHG